MVEQPVEHPAAATSATAARGAAAGAARTLGTGAVVGSALPEVEETASGRRSPSYDFAKLNLVGVAVGVSNHHRNGLPLPLGGRRSPAMRLDGELLVGADIDDGHIFHPIVLPFAIIARVVLQQSDAGEGILHQLPIGDLGFAGP